MQEIGTVMTVIEIFYVARLCLTCCLSKSNVKLNLNGNRFFVVVVLRAVVT